MLYSNSKRLVVYPEGLFYTFFPILFFSFCFPSFFFYFLFFFPDMTDHISAELPCSHVFEAQCKQESFFFSKKYPYTYFQRQIM